MKTLFYIGLTIAAGVVSYKLAQMSAAKSKRRYKEPEDHINED